MRTLTVLYPATAQQHPAGVIDSPLYRGLVVAGMVALLAVTLAVVVSWALANRRLRHDRDPLGVADVIDMVNAHADRAHDELDRRQGRHLNVAVPQRRHTDRDVRRTTGGVR